MRVATIPGPFSEVWATGVRTHALLSNVQCACTPQGTKAYLSLFHFLEDSITTPCFTNLLHPSGAMSTGLRCRSYSSFSSRAARRTPNPRRIIHVHLPIGLEVKQCKSTWRNSRNEPRHSTTPYNRRHRRRCLPWASFHLQASSANLRLMTRLR